MSNCTKPQPSAAGFPWQLPNRGGRLQPCLMASCLQSLHIQVKRCWGWNCLVLRGCVGRAKHPPCRSGSPEGLGIKSVWSQGWLMSLWMSILCCPAEPGPHHGSCSSPSSQRSDAPSLSPGTYNPVQKCTLCMLFKALHQVFLLLLPCTSSSSLLADGGGEWEMHCGVFPWLGEGVLHRAASSSPGAASEADQPQG